MMSRAAQCSAVQCNAMMRGVRSDVRVECSWFLNVVLSHVVSQWSENLLFSVPRTHESASCSASLWKQKGKKWMGNHLALSTEQ